VRDKDRSNFCDYFQFKFAKSADQSAPSREDRAKEDFLKLFGDGE
jgi:hypothetical protein